MHRTAIASLFAAALAGAVVASVVLPATATAPDVRGVVEAARAAVTANATAHCEIPCGIYDDHAEIERMRLDAITMGKASAQIVELSREVDAASLNSIARWAMIKEEHGRKLQHTVAWYFMTQRVKAPADPNDVAARETYHGRLAAFHAVSVAAMKSAQSLDPAATADLLEAIDVVAPWYPPAGKGAGIGEIEERHLALDAAPQEWLATPAGD